MVTVSSAFMSSRRSRIRRRVSAASGRLETDTGARRAVARGTAMVDRVVLSLSVAVHTYAPESPRLRHIEATTLKRPDAVKIVTRGHGFQWLPEPFRSARSAVDD